MADIGGKPFDGINAGIQAFRHFPQTARQVTDLVPPVGEVGDLFAVLDPQPHPFGGIRQTPQRAGNGRGEQDRQQGADRRRHPEGADNRIALLGDDLVDVAGFGRQQQHTQHRPEALHRHCNRDDRIAASGAAGLAAGAAGQRCHHLTIGGAVTVRRLYIKRQVALPEPVAELEPVFFQKVALLLLHRWQIKAQDLTAGIKSVGIENDDAVAVIDARPCAGWRDQPAQDRSNIFRVDGKVEIVELVFHRVGRFPRLQFQQAFRVDGDGIRIDTGPRRDGGGDDFTLSEEAFFARLDQTVAKLVEQQDARDQHEQGGHVEKDDALGQAGENVAGEKLTDRRAQ